MYSIQPAEWSSYLPWAEYTQNSLVQPSTWCGNTRIANFTNKSSPKRPSQTEDVNPAPLFIQDRACNYLGSTALHNLFMFSLETSL